MAITAVSTVVHSSPAMPKLSSLPETIQSREVRKLSLFCSRLGRASQSRNTPTKTTSKTMITPEPPAMPRNTWSPTLLILASLTPLLRSRTGAGLGEVRRATVSRGGVCSG